MGGGFVITICNNEIRIFLSYLYLQEINKKKSAVIGNVDRSENLNILILKFEIS